MSVHAQVQTEFKAYNNVTKLRIQQPFYSSAFSFFLGLSHFILIPPVCFFYHLSFVFFFHCFHLHTSVVAFFLLLCLSVSLWPFHCKILSPPWFPVFNGCGLGKKTQVRDSKSAVYWGKSFPKSQKRLQKRAKAESTKHKVCVQAGFKKRHFNSLCADSEVDYRFYRREDAEKQ